MQKIMNEELEGAMAARDGLKIDANPYNEDYLAYWYWLTGYSAWMVTYGDHKS